MPKLCAFVADPLAAYVRKGEVKARYFNPDNLFARVDIISPALQDVGQATVAMTAGNAELRIHSAGWLSRMSWRRFAHLRQFLRAEADRLVPLIAEAAPDVIRTFTPQIPGFVAMNVAKRLGVPFVVSVHANLDKDVREDALRRREFRLYMSNLLQRFLVERETLTRADLVICAYRWPAVYARKLGASRIEIVYNRVDTERFRPPVDRTDRPFTVLSVGRLLPERRPDVLIRAVALTQQVRLRLIGDGPLYEHLRELAVKLGMTGRVTLEKTVPNDQIHEAYRQADLYAHATRYGGIHIPIIEAMAAGLPLVVPRPKWEREPEIVADIAQVVEPTPESFAAAFRRLQADPQLRRDLGARGRERAIAMNGEKMERREADLYRELLRR